MRMVAMALLLCGTPVLAGEYQPHAGQWGVLEHRYVGCQEMAGVEALQDAANARDKAAFTLAAGQCDFLDEGLVVWIKEVHADKQLMLVRPKGSLATFWMPTSYRLREAQ